MKSGFRTKSEEIEWRRAKILELKSQGLDQREIARILQVTDALVSYDVKYMRDEAKQSIKDYTTEQLPLQFKITLLAVRNAMREFWNIAQRAQDNKEKMQALELYLDCHAKLCRSLWEGGSKLEQFLIDYGGDEYDYKNKQQHHYKDGDMIMPKEGSPYIYRSPDNGNGEGE